MYPSYITYLTGVWFLSNTDAHANDCVLKAFVIKQCPHGSQMEIAAPHAVCMQMCFEVRLAACQLHVTCTERVDEPRSLPFVMWEISVPLGWT